MSDLRTAVSAGAPAGSARLAAEPDGHGRDLSSRVLGALLKLGLAQGIW